MDNPTRRVLYELLASKVGMSQLINVIQQPTDTKNTFLFMDILVNIIQHNLPYFIEQFLGAKGRGLDTWKSILGIRIMDCLGFILIWLLDHPDIPEYLSANLSRSNVREIMEQYAEKSTLLILQSVERNKNQIQGDKLQFILQVINSFLLKEPDRVFNSLLVNWTTCIDLFSNFDSPRMKQKYFFAEAQKNFLAGIFQAMNNRIDENDLEIYNIWFQFVQHIIRHIQLGGNKTSMLTSCESNANIVVSSIWMRCLENPGLEWACNMMTKFGTKDYILNTGIKSQKAFTKFLIMMLSLMSNEQLQKLSSELIFLNSVTSRLESKVTIIAELGMIVADYVYNRLNGKPMFDISSYAFKRENFMKIFYQLDDQLSKFSTPLSVNKVISEIMQHANKNEIINIPSSETVPMTPLMVEMDYNSDNEDSDLDDPSVGRRSTVAKPVFLKDLLHYLTSDPQKDTTTYDKKGIAFSIGIEMVRIKKDSAELKYYSTKLLDAALDLDSVGFPLKEDEQFDEDQIKVAFDSWRLSFMIAICVSEPDTIFRYILENFVKQDWSVPTRIQVLTCIGLSCRELCGQEDSFIWGKAHLDKVELGKLSGPGHDLFRALDENQTQEKRIVDIDQEKREAQLVEALESVGIGKGTVVRKSRKLEIDKELRNSELAKGKTMQTSFINKKLPSLYYTMTAIWQQVNAHTYGTGFNVGSMSEYLNSHFLDILAMIYSCGVPSCIELIDMSIEQIAILSGQLQTVRARQEGEFPNRLFKAIVNGLRLLLTNNERTFSVLRTTAVLELTTLCELFAIVVQESPPLEEPTHSIRVAVLQQLQEYSLYSNV